VADRTRSLARGDSLSASTLSVPVLTVEDMTATVPAIIDTYVQAAAAADHDAVAACFTADAVVTDDGRTMVGRDEITRWRRELAAAFEYTVEVLGAQAVGDDAFLVTTKVAGTFPGSPVQLRYQFTLRDGLISGLDIAP
jgi:uncharacterized protein (TIGR02246 family)